MKNNFLRSIVAYYNDIRPDKPSMENVVFVLPNKRSVMFLKKYVQDTVTSVAMMPRMLTMHTFLSILSGRPEASQREQLFVLYQAYRMTMKSRRAEDTMRDFDSFVFWGDMMLSDFDDIDRSLVNAREIFRNLKQVKEIQANYLDDDQKAVIRRIWGESRLTASIEDFWIHIRPDHMAKEGDVTSKFIYLWEILADVYTNFHALLQERKHTNGGGLYRRALEAVKALGPDDINREKRYAFVGFNDLNTVETLIFNRLHDLDVADFFWDAAPLHLAGAETFDSKPLQRLKSLIKAFPMPAGYDESLPDQTPNITLTAVPSNIGQAKAVHDILCGWKEKDDKEFAGNNLINTCIVLPDQGLLLPCVMSLPDFVSKVNISMSLNYRTTTFATLLHSIISMQLRARNIHGTTHFFYEDVLAVLTHPHIRLVASEQAEEISQMISSNKMYNVDAAAIVEKADVLRPIFAPVADLDNVSQVAEYLINLFDSLATLLSSGQHAETPDFEIEALGFFKDEVIALERYVKEFNVTMTDRTFLVMFEKVFNSRGLTLNGSPLCGLQILGVLETRTLDFDNVIILSMNERVFPRKQYTKTMIPNNLRNGFGLPDFDSLEWTYAYCFYRLIARAKNVALFYDSRVDGQGNGEVSRYVSQLKYLMPGLKIESEALSMSQQPDTLRSITIDKTDDVMAHINEFRAGGALRLSASALKTYKKCPIEFYLSYARRMRGSDELQDSLSAAELGTIVHGAIQSIYHGYEGKVITAELIDSWLDPDSDIIENAVRENIVKIRYPKLDNTRDAYLAFQDQVAFEAVSNLVKYNLENERDIYCSDGKCFTFVANEMVVNGPWKIDDVLSVNFYMSIDRVDRLSDGRLRFIDFKTGADDFSASSIAALVSRTSTDRDGMFQLFIYSRAYNDMEDGSVEIQPIMHPMRLISTGAPLQPLKINGNDVQRYSDFDSDFEPLLKSLIKEIFDTDVPLTQTKDMNNCKYCNFKSLCGRIPKDYSK